jgi:hypothetical protein
MLFQPLLPKTKTVSIPVQYLEDGTAMVAKYKKMTGKGIEAQSILYQDGKSIDRFAHIGTSRRQEYTHMGRQVNHIRLNTWITRSRSSGSNPFPISIRKSWSTTTQSWGEDRNMEVGVSFSGNSTRAGAQPLRPRFLFQYWKLFILMRF